MATDRRSSIKSTPGSKLSIFEKNGNEIKKRKKERDP